MSTPSRIQAAFGQLLASTPGKNNSIFRLSRIYYILAVCAALSISISFLLNGLLHDRLSTSFFPHMLELILNWLVVFMAIGATVYGFRIARQAKADARKYEQSFQKSGQRANELAALYDTAQELAGQHDLSAVLQTIVGRAKTLLGTSGCAIFLRDASRSDFEIAAEIGAGMPIGAHLSFDEGIVGRVAQTSAPLIVNDYHDWPYRSQTLEQLPIGAAVCVPMIRAGELIGVLGVHEDTDTTRKFTEDEAHLLTLFADNAAGAVYNARLLNALRGSEERFRIAARCASDIVYDWDLANDHVDYFGAVYERSHAAAANLPKTRQEYWDMIHPEDRFRVRTALKSHFEEGKPFSEEYRIRNENGTYINVLDHGTAIRNSMGRHDKLIGAVVDITERKQAEQMRSDFVSFVTHQLRTPLSGVKWMLELAMEGSDTSEEMHSFIQDARASTDRLIGLVNDLLDVSRLERGKLQIACRDVDLADLTKCVVDEISPLVLEKGHVLTIHADNKLPLLYSDPQLLQQVILNLAANAIKYTAHGGNIKIRMRHDDHRVRWEIEDNGIGISKTDLEKLFEKFFRAGNALAVETEGTGLGLYLVRLIIERLGGNVWCQSGEGTGSTFLFDLPIESQEITNDKHSNSIGRG